MSETKTEAASQEPYEWTAADWPDPMQEVRDKAAAGDQIAALIVERVDKATNAVLADVLPKWEAQFMEGSPYCAGGLSDLLAQD